MRNRDADPPGSAASFDPDDLGQVHLDDYTFLTTDIVGSSEMFRRYPEDMIRTMEQHDTILQTTIISLGGDPFKHTGDGVFAVFAHPAQAVRAAVEAQRRMRAAEWGATGRPSIRWGIHTGSARRRGNDFFGPALSGASRLEEAANPDQVLVSEATCALCATDLAEAGIDLLDLGQHHFKGVAPALVFQACADGLPDRFGALRGKRETASGNLPAEVTSFVGRKAELQRLAGLMRHARIVTLLGPGGIGKTRLACEAARQAAPDFDGGTWLLNLGALDPGVEAWPVLASVLSLDAPHLTEKRAAVLRHLEGVRALIVIDNCEHMLDQVADLAATLTAECAGVSVICTSQRAIEVSGETLFEVPALGSAPNSEDAQSAALQLFVDRARLIRPDFIPDLADRRIIGKICEALENIPLAIEIAAGQVRRYPLAQIAAHAESPERMATARVGRTHRDSDRSTLRRTFDWSYGLLAPTSQQVLERLSVFSGSFHEEQAIEVCGLDIADEVQVLDAIDELIDASLLVAQIEGDRRLRMLRTLRAFGREKLAAHGNLAAFQQHHGEVYARRAEDLARQFVTEAEQDAARAILGELDNLRAAFERALEHDLALAARIVAPLNLYNYYHRGAETAAWPLRVMDRPGADRLPQAPLLLAGAASHVLHELGEGARARAYLARGEAAEAAGAGSSRGWLSHVAGHVALWSGKTDEFMQHHARAVAAARGTDGTDEGGDVALDIIDTATAAYLSGTHRKLDEARAMVAHLDALADSVRQPSLIGYIHFGRAGLAIATGSDSVIADINATIQWARIGGNVLGAQRAKRALTETLSRGADPARQLALYTAMLRELPEQGTAIYVWLGVHRLIAPLSALGRHQDLAVLAGALSTSPIDTGARMQTFMDRARDALGQSGFDAAFARGRSFDPKQARRYAMELAAGASSEDTSRQDRENDPHKDRRSHA